MFSDRIFQIAFLISLITHGVIFFQNTDLSLFSTPKIDQKLEVSYVLKSSPINKEEQTAITPKKELPLRSPTKNTIRSISPPPFIDKDNIFKESKDIISKESLFSKPAFVKPTFIKPDIISVKKIITLPPIDMDKIDNPSYISYYQVVREKIRRAAYQNYTVTEIGEVYVSFIISSEGYLKDMRLVAEKSSPSPYLKDTALKSIKDASPFPSFPKELDYPQLSFNVVISFEIE